MKKLVFLLLALFLFGCSAQDRASRFGGDIRIDEAPSDICVVNGDPKILGLNIEQNNDIALIYIENGWAAIAGDGGCIRGLLNGLLWLFAGAFALWLLAGAPNGGGL